MNLRRWLTNPIVIAAIFEFAVIVVIIVFVLNSK
jgi:hypothetical protein